MSFISLQMERVEKQVGEKRTYFDMQMERKSQHEEMDAVKNRGVVRAEEERISTGKWLKKEGVMEYGSEPPCSWQSVCYQGQSDEDSEDEWEEEEQEEENHNNHEQDQSGEEGGDDGEEEENEDDKEEREDDEEEEEPDEEEEDSQQEEYEYLVEGQDQEQKEGQQHDQVEDPESDIDGNLWIKEEVEGTVEWVIDSDSQGELHDDDYVEDYELKRVLQHVKSFFDCWVSMWTWIMLYWYARNPPPCQTL